MTSSDAKLDGVFAEEVKTNSISIPTYRGRLILRTHHDDDTARCASIYSDPISRRYLRFLQPPHGWRNDEHQWTVRDFADRAQVQKETRANGKSCAFNTILPATTSGESNDRCIGTTGFVTIENGIGYLGIISDGQTVRRGYATEALHMCVVFAFDKLGVTTIIMQTDEQNEEMRGWCENTAGLTVNSKALTEVNGYSFVQCEYVFTLDEWNASIRERLERKMNNIDKDSL